MAHLGQYIPLKKKQNVWDVFQQSSSPTSRCWRNSASQRRTISETSIIWCPVLSFGLLRLVDDFFGGNWMTPSLKLACCWWMKSQTTTWPVWNPVYDEIFTIWTGAWFVPWTVVHHISHVPEHVRTNVRRFVLSIRGYRVNRYWISLHLTWRGSNPQNQSSVVRFQTMISLSDQWNYDCATFTGPGTPNKTILNGCLVETPMFI